MLLSGTPLQNNVEELFSLLNFLEPDQFKSSIEFMGEFGNLQTEGQVDKLKAVSLQVGCDFFLGSMLISVIKDMILFGLNHAILGLAYALCMCIIIFTLCSIVKQYRCLALLLLTCMNKRWRYMIFDVY